MYFPLTSLIRNLKWTRNWNWRTKGHWKKLLHILTLLGLLLVSLSKVSSSRSIFFPTFLIWCSSVDGGRGGGGRCDLHSGGPAAARRPQQSHGKSLWLGRHLSLGASLPTSCLPPLSPSLPSHRCPAPSVWRQGQRRSWCSTCSTLSLWETPPLWPSSFPPTAPSPPPRECWTSSLTGGRGLNTQIYVLSLHKYHFSLSEVMNHTVKNKLVQGKTSNLTRSSEKYFWLVLYRMQKPISSPLSYCGGIAMEPGSDSCRPPPDKF